MVRRNNLDSRNMYKKMNLLFENPVLAARDLDGMNSYFSNCHGTVAYVLGVEDIFRKLAQKPEDFVCVDGRPAYADRDLMKTFLETYCASIRENHKSGDVVALWSNIHRGFGVSASELLKRPPVKTIEHTAILVEPETEGIFTEQETGKPFEFSTIDRYISEWFADFRKRGVNIFVDFYRRDSNL